MRSTLLVAAVAGSLGAATALETAPLASAPRGGRKDAHGCPLGAGYSWCEPKSKCLRIWEEPCPGTCDKVLEAVCPEAVASPSLEAAITCAEEQGENLKKLGCGVPKEALEVLGLAFKAPETFAALLKESGLAAVVEKENLGSRVPRNDFAIVDGTLPTVFAHGMGDSCFNEGMKQITADTGKHIGSYSVCVPTGDNVLSDTINGFLLNMDKSVDVFAEKIRKDPKLQGGFNAIGFSQGNSLIRGYIHKYNSPPVHNVLHVHGTVSGVSGFPQCNPTSALCRGVSQLCGDLAFNSLVQGILFQADYFRDPRLVNASSYLQHSQLARWNNEASPNATYKSNFVSVNKLVMVKALQDTMVFPNEGEWWGHFADNTYEAVPMNETRWYKEDLFGLKTLDGQGKIHFEVTEGNHLQFTEQQLFAWVDKYF